MGPDLRPELPKVFGRWGVGFSGVAQKPEAGGAAPLLESCICMTMSPLSPSQANNIIPGL